MIEQAPGEKARGPAGHWDIAAHPTRPGVLDPAQDVGLDQDAEVEVATLAPGVLGGMLAGPVIL